MLLITVIIIIIIIIIMLGILSESESGPNLLFRRETRPARVKIRGPCYNSD
jgi:hypothetical protein